MNLLLQDPFAVLKEYPEKLTRTLENPLRTECLQFSPCGNYLALGCSTGDVVIYDMDTFRPSCILGSKFGAHTRIIQSISWSPDGRYLLTGSGDWIVKVWDLQSPEQPLNELAFDSPIWNCQWFNVESLLCIVTTFEENCAYLVDFKGQKSVSRAIDTLDTNEVDRGYVLTCNVCTKNPNIIITGTSKGWVDFIQIITTSPSAYEFNLLHAVKIANSNIKDVIISQNGDRIAVNSSDRTIRQYSLNISDNLS